MPEYRESEEGVAHQWLGCLGHLVGPHLKATPSVSQFAVITRKSLSPTIFMIQPRDQLLRSTMFGALRLAPGETEILIAYDEYGGALCDAIRHVGPGNSCTISRRFSRGRKPEPGLPGHTLRLF
jgi:hypothetical protein